MGEGNLPFAEDVPDRDLHEAAGVQTSGGRNCDLSSCYHSGLIFLCDLLNSADAISRRPQIKKSDFPLTALLPRA